jgi:NAD(P)-dependent dehydrogenase (short-subunit alcohol dehydrogenase family)
MYLLLHGKVSLVTGASRGIGAATACKLASLGSDVVLNFRSKHEGEEALRKYAAELVPLGISLVVVSGDAIEETITPRLLERQQPGLLERRRDEANRLPTVDEFAEVIARAAMDKQSSKRSYGVCRIHRLLAT